MTALTRPCRGHVTQEFANLQPDGHPHTGTDYAYTDGVRVFPEVFAAAPGKVLYAGDSRGLGWPNPWYFNPDFDRSDSWDSSAGNVIVIDHGDGVTTYSHLESWTVKKDQLVSRGQRIATIGNTGNSYGKHLHFEWIPYPFDFGTATYGRARPVFNAPVLAPASSTPTPKPATTKGPLMALTDNEQTELLRKVRELHRDLSQGIPGVRDDGDSFRLIRDIGRKVGAVVNETARKAKYGKK